MDRAEAEAILDGDRETAIALLMRIGELIEANRRLEARVAELEQRLNRTSQNSSLPPSQDPPSAPPRPQRSQSGRRPGGQPGHKGKHRKLVPLEQVDEIVEHWPGRCGKCGHAFLAEQWAGAAPVYRHQLAELPPPAVRVTEHRLHRLRCPKCAKETRAALPAQVPRGAFGPRLEAAVATLAVRNRISRRDTVELLGELFGAELSVGSVDAIISHAAEALKEPYEELGRQVREARALNIDETGWRRAGVRRTLWGVLTASQALFRIAPDRHQREAEALLGSEFAGIVCSDRWWAYDYLNPERRQLCSRPSDPGLHRPRRGPGRPEGVRGGGACPRRTDVRSLGGVPRGR
ncbi:MAG: transposase [Thermoleophilia bacterium]|nr:transposase [Thermoleophilia bacterium]